MKNILILTMSCQDPFFESQIDIIKKTWAANLPDNIEWMYYTGGHKCTRIDGNHIKLNCEDDLPNTYKKTYRAFQCVDLGKYDYVVRTNTSTYINVRLLNEFINTVNTTDVTYGSDLYSLTEGYAPYPLYIFARGNCMILPRKHIQIILTYGISLTYLEKVDDMMIGNVLNSFYLTTGEDYLNHIAGIPHAWYKCTPNKLRNGHKISMFGNDDGAEFYKDCISIQIKKYGTRNGENENYLEFHNMLSQFEYSNIEESVNKAIEYSNDPSIFIGSILGYIDYLFWESLDKEKLFFVEFTHKAVDDAERKKFLAWCDENGYNPESFK